MAQAQKEDVNPEVEDDIEIEVEDDTPPEDRNREPMPKPLLEELEEDELDQYEGKVKEKLKQMRKVWHDERRAKEAAAREQAAALDYAKKVMAENKRLKETLTAGGKEYATMLSSSAEAELAAAKSAYRDAYEAGDADKLIEAQSALQQANFKIMQAKNFQVPTLQEEEVEVQHPQVPSQPAAVNPKLLAWQERNPWYGSDDEMTAAAPGLHEKIRKAGQIDIGSDEYFAVLDKTIRKRFPEHFETDEPKGKSQGKQATVVAPAVRNAPSNKIRLTASQVAIAKKLGITPKQYAMELKKMESEDD